MNELLKTFKKNLTAGKVYRRQELERWSNAIDRHLGELVKEGDLKKLSQGLYKASILNLRDEHHYPRDIVS
jgi:hypothetical protein